MYTVALFGEAEKGDFKTPYLCTTLPQLADSLGEPPSLEAQGLFFAVQALLFEWQVLFFRVREEGFSANDYLYGLKMLSQGEKKLPIAAIGLPGVGDAEIIEATDPICQVHKSALILTERDLYDYLTSAK